ncbi:Leucoanthocyanidin dioxygenase [Platanthera zijinensis]|uniref:Leucoanthocyanidin dioxygenase n=1 Tax=Platanthera zijinensis TaxID=2320716 RepID=A0AAP0B6W7_9ASPA
MAATSTALPPPPPGFVKELAEQVGSSSSAVPSLFITRNQADADAEADADITRQIPSIDFLLLKEGNPDERLRAVRDLGRAFEEWGFFKLVNHGISESLQTSMVKAFMEFFDQTLEEKHVYDMNQILDSICYGTGYGMTTKEHRYWRDFLRMFVRPELHSPAKPADFRAILEEFVLQTREVFNELLRAVWESLELEESFMEDSLQLKTPNQVLVGNIFPPCPQPELVLGMPPHTDMCLLTLLIQSNVFNGLQVMHDGKWVLVDLVPPTLFIFTGDFLEIVSNGRYKTTLHRVIVSNEHTRISVGTSIAPPLEDVVIAPAPELLSSDSPAIFRGITFKEYTTLKRNHNSTDSTLDVLKL